MDKGPLWEMERGERRRERERILCDRVRGMRKTQKTEPCVFPREVGGRMRNQQGGLIRK